MNTCQYLDGYVACAQMANRGDKPVAALTDTFTTDYAAGWLDALETETYFRCMRPEFLELYAPDAARFALACRSDNVRGCSKCRGLGWLTIKGHDPEEQEQVDCVCLESALDAIALEIGK